MPKRIKDHNNTVLVRFKDYVSDKKINSILKKMDIFGVRVSTVVNRWAVEVPYWRENEYSQKLKENKHVDHVHGAFGV